jgi:zinc protease
MRAKQILLLSLFAGIAASAPAQEKQKPPQGGPPKPFTVPAAQTFAFKNGAKVTMVPYGSVPKVTVRVVVDAGNINEGPDQIWLADITGRLLKEGTKTRSSEQIAQQAAGMGGSVTVGVGPDDTTIGGDALSEFAPDLVNLLADVTQHPVLLASELQRVRTDMLRVLAIQRSRPSSQADEAFAKAIYGDHPYGRIFPTEAMLKSLTIEDVQQFYKSNFGAARTRIYVAGRFDPTLKQAITKAFEGWDSGPARVTNVPKTTPAKSFVLIDRPGASQSTIRFGLPLPPPTSPDYLPLVVTDSILGGSFASRITTNIREQKGYTYSPGSSISTHFHDAYWDESADVTTAVTGPALQEIVNEIKLLRKDPPSANELEGIKSYLAGIFVIRNSSRQGVIGQLRFVDQQGLGDSWLRSYIPNVLKVTPQDVQRIAESYLSPDKMALVVVGDKSKIAEQLTQFSQ